ncbi:MAG TPA: hypothetical protein VMW50_03175 [Dehalococcoidia bacterium]|nr:hypothetical protein [Dehalococcoidia bacterium]
MEYNSEFIQKLIERPMFSVLEEAYNIRDRQSAVCRYWAYTESEKTHRQKLQKQYYLENRNKILKQKKEYCQKNKVKRLSKAKEYYLENRDKIKNYQKQHREENEPRLLQESRDRYQKNRDRNLLYAKKRHQMNKETDNKKSRNRRKEMRLEILKILGGECQRCGITDHRVLQIDHVCGGGKKELKKGGNYHVMKNIIKNPECKHKYQLLCANCNWIKRHENKEYQKGRIRDN